jgi:hypothetical protein
MAKNIDDHTQISENNKLIEVKHFSKLNRPKTKSFNTHYDIEQSIQFASAAFMIIEIYT